MATTAPLMTTKGQVTIHKAARDRAGLRPGQPVSVETRDDGVIELRALNHAENEAERVRRFEAGLTWIDANPVDPGIATDAFMATIREPLEPFELEPGFDPYS